MELLVGINWTSTSLQLNCGSFTIESNLFRRASAGTWISSGDPPYHGFNALCDNLAFNVDPVTMQDPFAVALNTATGMATWEIVEDHCMGCRHALSILGNDLDTVVTTIVAKIDERMATLGLCVER